VEESITVAIDLSAALRRIGGQFAAAKTESYDKHPLAQFIRQDAAEALATALGELSSNLLCHGSAGAGKWADVPWLAVFDPIVTDSATRGYYVVYLFNVAGSEVHLSLNQGTTAVRKEFKRTARAVLQDRAALMRARLPEFVANFSVYDLELGSGGTLPRDYEAGHAFGVAYSLAALPSEQELRSQLQHMVRGYLALTFRGGLEPSPETEADDPVLPPGTPPDLALLEIRRYRYHRRIERNPTTGEKVKAVHGHRCQACGLLFTEVYGPLGEGYIEAHHLRPLSSLDEGISVAYSPKDDFAVLCANCHRMIHRTSDPSDLAAFRTQLNHASNA
jgi:5-methylcytosine-specific restriction enzyme A